MVIIGIIGLIINKKIREGFFGRFNTFGILDHYINSLGKGDQIIYWFHVSSHGEFLQTRPVLLGLKEIEPKIKIIVSFFSTSRTVKSNLFFNKLFANLPPTFPSPINPIFITTF